MFRLYRDISFDMHRSPCRPKQSAGRTGGAGRPQVGLRGFFSHAQNPKSRLYGLIGPLSFSEGRRGRGKVEGQGDGEVCRRGRCKVASQMTTAHIN
ncbi:MAG: hypothetical protein CL932_22595 [Deltaproteobacteria bacterium]|nr:hypothetical protein [Deltaproteobacteria bacterium]